VNHPLAWSTPPDLTVIFRVPSVSDATAQTASTLSGIDRMMTVAELLKTRNGDRGLAPAILATGKPPASYADILDQVTRCAVSFRQEKLGRRARIAVSVTNGPEAATSFLAVAACATCVPLNPAYQADEIRFFLQDARADAVVMSRHDFGPIRSVAAAMGLPILSFETDTRQPAGCFTIARASAGADPEPDALTAQTAVDWPDANDVALILHTSGTTARPKAVPLTQANLLAAAQAIAAHLGLGTQDRGLNVMPLFHIHGLVGSLLSTLVGGGSLACASGFDASTFFDQVAEFQPTWYTAVPAIHQAIVDHGEAYRRGAPLHRFRFVRSSSAALPPSTLVALETLLEAPVVEAYGMTEASHQMTSNPLPPRPRKPGSVGLPAGVDVAILDESGCELAPGTIGEIAVRGPGVTAGYENNPEANAGSFTRGWFRTGDQGRLDADGYLHISGRLKEIINRGGEKIWPREVDEALLEHEDVAQASAFAVAHPSLGEDLAAAVVPRPGRRPDEAALREYLFSRLAAFKVPSQIVVVDEIPKGPTGKIQRTSLCERLGPLLARPFVAPGSWVEKAIEAVFRETLKCGPLGIHANFFASGGDSLKGTRTIGRLNDRLSLDLPVTAIFRHPTIASLAGAIEALLHEAPGVAMTLQSEVDALSDEQVDRMLADFDLLDQAEQHSPPRT
jgi:oxalate---CoA ligase